MAEEKRQIQQEGKNPFVPITADPTFQKTDKEKNLAYTTEAYQNPLFQETEKSLKSNSGQNFFGKIVESTKDIVESAFTDNLPYTATLIASAFNPASVLALPLATLIDDSIERKDTIKGYNVARASLDAMKAQGLPMDFGEAMRITREQMGDTFNTVALEKMLQETYAGQATITNQNLINNDMRNKALDKSMLTGQNYVDNEGIADFRIANLGTFQNFGRKAGLNFTTKTIDGMAVPQIEVADVEDYGKIQLALDDMRKYLKGLSAKELPQGVDQTMQTIERNIHVDDEAYMQRLKYEELAGLEDAKGRQKMAQIMARYGRKGGVSTKGLDDVLKNYAGSPKNLERLRQLIVLYRNTGDVRYLDEMDKLQVENKVFVKEAMDTRDALEKEKKRLESIISLDPTGFESADARRELIFVNQKITEYDGRLRDLAQRSQPLETFEPKVEGKKQDKERKGRTKADKAGIN